MKRRRTVAGDDALRPGGRQLVLPAASPPQPRTDAAMFAEHGVNDGSASGAKDRATGLERRAAAPISWEQGREYGIVVDAGSSGSRIQIYSWKKHELAKAERKGTGKGLDVLPRVETGVQEGDGWHLKVEPGISTFGTHPDDVGDYLKPLLDHAKSIIPPSAAPSTPFYLLATAGMRLLPDTEREAVLAKTCSFVRDNYPFSLSDCASQVKVITGEEEGAYGWVAVNYLMDGFDSHSHTPGGTEKTAATYGFLDMGGASTQIAFEPNAVERVNHADNLTDLRLRLLNGRDVVHQVFVTTWLGYGTNQARERYLDAAVRAYEVAHPDAPTPTADAAVTIKDPCLPPSLKLPGPRNRSGYVVEGTGDFVRCMRDLSPLLNKNAPCLDEPCLFDGKHVPPIDFSVNHFIGISEYWYSTHDVWSMGGVYDFVTFEKNAIEYCGRLWDDIVRDHKEGNRWPAQMELSRLQMQCFKAAWIVNILHEGIGIPRIVDKGGQGDRKDHTGEAMGKAAEKGLTDAPPSFQSLNEVGDVAVSWTLGKMVLEVSQSVPGNAPAVIGGEYEDGARGPHIPQAGVGSAFAHGARAVDPLALVGLAALVLVLWSFCGSGRIGRSILVKFLDRRPARDAGYVMASMEEGGGYESGGSQGYGRSNSAASRRSGGWLGGRAKLLALRLKAGLAGKGAPRGGGLPTFGGHPGSPPRPWSLRRAATSPAHSQSRAGGLPSRPGSPKPQQQQQPAPPLLPPTDNLAVDAPKLRPVRSTEQCVTLRPLSRQSGDRDRDRPRGVPSSASFTRTSATPPDSPRRRGGGGWIDGGFAEAPAAAAGGLPFPPPDGLSVLGLEEGGAVSLTASPNPSLTNLNTYFSRRGGSNRELPTAGGNV